MRLALSFGVKPSVLHHLYLIPSLYTLGMTVTLRPCVLPSRTLLILIFCQYYSQCGLLLTPNTSAFAAMSSYAPPQDGLRLCWPGPPGPQFTHSAKHGG